jgi:tRNA(Ile2) C34 agmatinyltransferase TiaS
MYIDEKLIKLLEPHSGSEIDVSYAIRLIKIVTREYEIEQLTILDNVKCKGCEESTGETKLFCCNHCGKRTEYFTSTP